LLISDQQVTEENTFSTLLPRPAGFQWWRSGDITRTQNVSEYIFVFALCHCQVSISEHTRWLADVAAACEDGVPSEA